MKTIRTLVLWWVAASIFVVSAVNAQSNSPATVPPPFKAEELDALLAPIALYPDSLLVQILMAATYPLEVVQAARWSKANPKLNGDAAVKKVEGESWDVSVKSLVAFPVVLEMMNEKLDWTQKLGDAFLGQQKDVMASVQRLRQQAQSAGNLQSNQQQVVRTEAQAIIIEPAQPQTIYVPTYNPTVVYGTWAYPAYPPYYYPPPAYYYPGGALATGFAWGLGIAAGAALIGGANWGHGDVNVNVNRATNIDRNYSRNNVSAGGNWQHNPQHRGNVGYRDQGSRERYSGGRSAGADGRGDYRGRDGDRGGDRDGIGGGDRGGSRDGVGGGDRGGSRDGVGGGDRGGSRDGVGGGDRAGQGNRPSHTGGASAFDGVGGGNRDLDRGRASTSQTSRGGGGGSPSFGGGGGGGGRSFSGGGGGGGRTGGGGGGGRGGRR